MDASRFDRAVKAVAAGGSRRALARLGIGGALAAALSRFFAAAAGAGSRDDAACEGKRPCHQPHPEACLCDKCAQDFACVCAKGADGGVRCVDTESFHGFANRRDRCRRDADCRADAVCIDHQGCAWDLSRRNPVLRWQRYCAAKCRR